MKVHNVNKKAVLAAALMTALSSSTFAAGVGNNVDAAAAAQGAEAFGHGNTIAASATSSLAFGTDNVAKGANSLVFGERNQSIGDNSFAGGNDSKAKGRDSFAFGATAEANVEYTVAIGNEARTNAYNTVAIGNGAFVSGESSVALGRTNNVEAKNAVVIGANNGVTNRDPSNQSIPLAGDTTIKSDQSVVVGYNNVVQGNAPEQLIFGSNSTTKGQGAVAIGTHVKATEIDAIAVGNNTIADRANSVALGTNSVTDDVVSTTDVTLAGKSYNFAGASAASTISVGSASRPGAGGVVNYKRTVTNVAAGRVDASSTDAINGSQFNAAAQAINQNYQNINANKQAAADAMAEAKKHSTVVAGANTSVTEGTNAAGGKEYTVSVKKVLTDLTSAEFKDGVDKITNVGASGVTVSGPNANVVYGPAGMVATDTDLNGKTVQFTTSAISVGGNQIHGLADGSADNDAVTVGQLNGLKDKVDAFKTAQDRINSRQDGINNSIGETLSRHDDAIDQANEEAKKHTTVVAGANTSVTEGTNAAGGKEYTVAVNRDLNAMNTVTFGTVNDPQHNVASKNGIGIFDGDVDTNYKADGIHIENRNNLDSASHDINGVTADSNGKHVAFTTDGIDAGGQTIHNVGQATVGTDAINKDQLDAALSGIAGNVNNYGDTINANQREARHGIAGTAALASLHPLAYDPTAKVDFMAGYGHFHNANAAALGLAIHPNENLMVTMGSTITGGSDTVYNAGVSYHFGKGTSKVASSNAKLVEELAQAQKEIAQLKADNEQMKEDNAKFKAALNKALGLHL